MATADQPPAGNLTSGGRGWRWADLMRRVFAVDVRILRHLALPTEVPAPTPARAPPDVADWAV